MQVDLAEALGNNWLELWYQPKLDVQSLKPRGVEALIRLRHPTGASFRRPAFCPSAAIRISVPCPDFVIGRPWRTGCASPSTICRSRSRSICRPPYSAIRVFLDRIRRGLPEHPAFSRLIVEISAPELIEDFARVRDNARRLHAIGIGLSIDNVGTECSSLMGLDGVPVAELKVGHAFVAGCATDRLKRAACCTLLDTARHLGARAVAVGVETRADLLAVRGMGFDLVQGFLFGRPMEARKFARALRQEVMEPI